MSAATDSMELALMAHALEGQAGYTPPENRSCELFTVAPDDAGAGGTAVADPAAFTVGPSDWKAAASGAIACNEISSANASSPVSGIVAWTLKDGSTARFRGALSAGVDLSGGQPFTFPADALTITGTGNFKQAFWTRVLDWLFNDGDDPFPASVIWELCSDVASATAAGTPFDAASYVGLTTAMDDTVWDGAANPGTNIVDLTWGEAEEDWGTVRSVEGRDASTDDPFAFWIPPEEVAIDTNGEYVVPAGSFTLAID